MRKPPTGWRRLKWQQEHGWLHTGVGSRSTEQVFLADGEGQYTHREKTRKEAVVLISTGATTVNFIFQIDRQR